MLNEALATEIVCYLRYKRHYFMARGIIAEAAAAEFLQHATEEQGHADQIALRITQLQGKPNFDPEGITVTEPCRVRGGRQLGDMIREDLVAERVAIESYSEIIRWLGDNDPTTRNLMETILAVEEEHANDMFSLLEDLAERPVTPNRASWRSASWRFGVHRPHAGVAGAKRRKRASCSAGDHDLGRDLIDRAGELGQVAVRVEQ